MNHFYRARCQTYFNYRLNNILRSLDTPVRRFSKWHSVTYQSLLGLSFILILSFMAVYEYVMWVCILSPQNSLEILLLIFMVVLIYGLISLTKK